MPYVSFSINRLPDFLDLISELEPVQRKELTSKVSIKFDRSEKTIEEFITSLKNLRLIVQKDNKIYTSELSKEMLSSDKKDFWKHLRESLLDNNRIRNILEAIENMSRQKVKVKSSENYYAQLSTTLRVKFGFSHASPRRLSRFITLFKKTHILDYDPFLDEYFLISKRSVSDDTLRRITKREYKQLKSVLEKKTGTTWVPIHQLCSRVCQREGIEVNAFYSFMRRALDKGEFQYAQASASRVEVRKGGIEKGGTIYFYVKIPEEEEKL